MDDPVLDPETQERIEAFRRQMDASSVFCNRAMISMARERMFRDWDAMNRPPVPETGLLQQAAAALASLFKRPNRAKENSPTVIVVEPTIVPPHHHIFPRRNSQSQAKETFNG
jgi:hypothetical protein